MKAKIDRRITRSCEFLGEKLSPKGKYLLDKFAWRCDEAAITSEAEKFLRILSVFHKFAKEYPIHPAESCNIRDTVCMVIASLHREKDPVADPFKIRLGSVFRNGFEVVKKDKCMSWYIDSDLMTPLKENNLTHVFADGSVYEGTVLNGKRQGHGELRCKNGGVYVGEWKNDKKHGFGTMCYANGSQYVGEFKYDKRYGFGIQMYKSVSSIDESKKCKKHGGIYAGEWKQGHRRGKGAFLYADGGMYEGEWLNSRRHGHGTFKTVCGVYEGEWQEGAEHGYGVYRYADGSVYEGEWRQGYRHGSGVVTSNFDSGQGSSDCNFVTLSPRDSIMAQALRDMCWSSYNPSASEYQSVHFSDDCESFGSSALEMKYSSTSDLMIEQFSSPMSDLADTFEYRDVTVTDNQEIFKKMDDSAARNELNSNHTPGEDMVAKTANTSTKPIDLLLKLLLTACQYGEYETMMVLLESGCSSNSMNCHGVSILSLAAQFGHTKVVRKLVDVGANVNSLCNNRRSPLYNAAGSGHIGVCEFLVKSGAAVNMRCTNNETALFNAANCGHGDTVELLIQYFAEFDIVDDYGRSPMWWACHSGHEDVVRVFMRVGASTHADYNSITPMQIAAQNRHARVCELLNAPFAKVCVICLYHYPSVLFQPCNDFICCLECNCELEKRHIKRCPRCYKDIAEAMTVKHC